MGTNGTCRGWGAGRLGARERAQKYTTEWNGDKTKGERTRVIHIQIIGAADLQGMGNP